MTNFLRVDLTASALAIIAGVIHLGAYWGLWWHPAETGTELYWRVGISVGFIVVGCTIVGILTGVFNKEAPASDELEDQVNYRAMRNSLFTYSGGLAIIFMEAFDTMQPMNLAHAVIGVFIAAEIVRMTSLGYYLKRGI